MKKSKMYRYNFLVCAQYRDQPAQECQKSITTRDGRFKAMSALREAIMESDPKPDYLVVEYLNCMLVER